MKERILQAVIFALSLNQFCFADDVKKLEEVSVSSAAIVQPTKQTQQTVYSGFEVTKEGIEIGGNQAQMSVYDAINILPDVSFTSADNTGLYAEGDNLRIRGVKGYSGSMTIEGVPNYGGAPMGPRDYIYNLQNFKAIKVYESAVPASLGVGVGNRGGAIELEPLWPQETMRFAMQQAVGSHDLYTNFFRFDSGALPATNTRFSASYSYGISNKWRGPGEIGPRNNVNFMINQPVTDILDAKLFFNYNYIRQDLYRALRYAQINDIYTDFNSSKTGVASKDINYYGYNHGDFENTDVLSVLTIKLDKAIDVILKPYYSKENTYIWQGIEVQNIIQKRTRDIERKGIIAQVNFNIDPFKVSTGMQYEISNMNIYNQNYAIVNDILSYRGFGVFATTGDTYIKSPFLQVASDFGKFSAQAGIKYFRFNDSPSEG